MKIKKIHALFTFLFLFPVLTFSMKPQNTLRKTIVHATMEKKFKKIEQSSLSFAPLEKNIKNAIQAVQDPDNYNLLFMPNVSRKAVYSFMTILSSYMNVYKFRNTISFKTAQRHPAIEAAEYITINQDKKSDIFFVHLQEKDFGSTFQNYQLEEAKSQINSKNQSRSNPLRFVVYLKQYNQKIQRRSMPANIEIIQFKSQDLKELIRVCPIFLQDEHLYNIANPDYEHLSNNLKTLKFKEQKKVITHIKARAKRKRSMLTTKSDIEESISTQLMKAPKKVKLAKPDFSFLKKFQIPTSNVSLEKSYAGTRASAINDFIDYVNNPEAFKVVMPNQYCNILMHGPPGTGKTLLSKIIAHETQAACFKLDSRLFNKWFRESAANMSKIFNLAKQYTKRHKKNVIILIDEADSIIMPRFDSYTHQEDRNITNEVNKQIDELLHDNVPVFIVAITNELRYIDSATKSRFPVMVKTKLPNKENREKIFTLHLQNRKKEKNVNTCISQFAQRTDNFSGRDIFSVLNEAAKKAVRENKKDPCIKIAHIFNAIEGYKKNHRHLQKQKQLSYFT